MNRYAHGGRFMQCARCIEKCTQQRRIPTLLPSRVEDFLALHQLRLCIGKVGEVHGLKVIFVVRVEQVLVSVLFLVLFGLATSHFWGLVVLRRRG